MFHTRKRPAGENTFWIVALGPNNGVLSSRTTVSPHYLEQLLQEHQKDPPDLN